MEAYSEVYAPQEVDEAITSEKGKAKMKAMLDARTTASGRAKSGQGDNVATIKHIGRSNRDGLLGTPPNRKVAGSNWPKSYTGIGGTGNKAARRAAALKKEDFDIFDVVLEFLQAEGYAETLEEAEWLMANMIDEEAIGIILGEAITSEKGKAKAAEMIAKRTTASGRAKSGQGANVATIKHIGRSEREGLRGTPATRSTSGSNRPKSYTGIGGTGNKAAKRAAALKKEDFELWVNELVEEGYDLSDYTWDEMYDIYEAEKPFPYEKVKAKQVALRDKGSAGLDRRMKMGVAVRRAKEAEKTGGSQRDAGKGWYHAKEDYVNEAQHARENPEKYEREQAKKSAPVRGEKTPMPPRGDKRREDFEKWYAKQMGR